MKTRIALAAAIAAVLAAVLALPAQSAFAADVSAKIVANAANLADKAFSPNPIEAKTGDTVTWTNTDTSLHTVTQGDATNGATEGGFDSKVLAPNKTFSYTFAKAGDFPYYCQLHPTMVGVVKVAVGGTPEQTVSSASTTLGGNTYTVNAKSTAGAKVTTLTIKPQEEVGVQFSGSGDIELTMPKSMISGITSVTAGDQKVDFTEVTSTSTDTTIKVMLPSGENSLEIKGAIVVPEFGVIAASVFAVSLVAAVGFARFKGSSFGLGRF